VKDGFATEAQRKAGAEGKTPISRFMPQGTPLLRIKGVDSRNFVVDGASPADRKTYCNGTRAMERVPAPVGSGVMFP